MSLKLWLVVPCAPSFGLAFRSNHVGRRWGFPGYQFMLRSRPLVRALLTSTVVAAAMALAACTSDGTPASTESSGGIDSFVRNLFGSKNQDQTPVTHNEPPVGPSAPKSKPAGAKPKHPAVAAAGAHPNSAERGGQPASNKSAIDLVPKPSPKRQASAEPLSMPESTTLPLLTGAAPTLPVGSFDNRFSSWR
jgi:hypothetical protein